MRMVEVCCLFVLSTVIGLAAFIGQVSSSCDDSALQRCLQPLSRYKLGMKTFDVTKLKHACGVYPDVTHCVNTLGYIESCNSATYLQWVRTDASLQFGCGIGYKDLELVAPCMQRPIVKRQISACKFEFNRDFCRFIVKYIQCMGLTARRFCGDIAGNVTLGLANRVAKATADASGLTCAEEKQHTGSLRLAIGLSISVILVIVAIVGVVVWAKKKHESRKQQSLLHNDFLQLSGDGKD